MKGIVFFAALILAGGLAVTGNARMKQTEEHNVKKGVVKAWRLGDTDYCHLKFPPIKVSTLYSDNPELADPEHTQLRDYYGPCDYNPLGAVEIQRQQDELQQQQYNFG